MVKISEASEYHANEDNVNVVPLKTANVSDWAHKLRSSFGEHRFFSLGEHGFFRDSKFFSSDFFFQEQF